MKMRSRDLEPRNDRADSRRRVYGLKKSRLLILGGRTPVLLLHPGQPSADRDVVETINPQRTNCTERNSRENPCVRRKRQMHANESFCSCQPQKKWMVNYIQRI